LNELWSNTGMRAHKWLLNSAKVLKRIPPESRASKVRLTSDGLPMVKTLGVTWLPEEDVFTFKANPVGKDFPITKQNFLKTISKLLDPVGFSPPFIVRAKILLQANFCASLSPVNLREEQGDFVLCLFSLSFVSRCPSLLTLFHSTFFPLSLLFVLLFLGWSTFQIPFQLTCPSHETNMRLIGHSTTRRL